MPATDIQTTTPSQAAIIERVMVEGDLSKLSPQERTAYYLRTCESLSLNPMTRPFEYITLNAKLVLYARKDAADQLRRRDDISIGKPDIQFQDDLIIVTVEARTASGRTDSDVGVVKKSDMRGDVANALMKAITKAKRRVTLSICGLGFLDETEVETIPDARPFTEQPAPTNGKPPAPDATQRTATAGKAAIMEQAGRAKLLSVALQNGGFEYGALEGAIAEARKVYGDRTATIGALYAAASDLHAANDEADRLLADVVPTTEGA